MKNKNKIRSNSQNLRRTCDNDDHLHHSSTNIAHNHQKNAENIHFEEIRLFLHFIPSRFSAIKRITCDKRTEDSKYEPPKKQRPQTIKSRNTGT